MRRFFDSDSNPACGGVRTGVGIDAIEGLRFLASLPLAGTGRTEGGEKTQPFNRFHSRLFIYKLHVKALKTLGQIL